MLTRLVMLTVLGAVSMGAQAPTCGLEGDAKMADVRALNRLKNRTAPVREQDIDPTVTTAALIAPGSRWNENKAARITAFVRGVRVGGIETVNCHAKAVEGRDTHIELVVSARDAEDETRMVVVEVTPRVRAMAAARGEDWSTAALRRNLLGRNVVVTGWLMPDGEHEANAENTKRGRAKIWRATEWEIHPVMDIHPSGEARNPPT